MRVGGRGVADSDGAKGGEWFTLRVVGKRCVSVAGVLVTYVGSRQSVHCLKGQCGQANASIALIC